MIAVLKDREGKPVTSGMVRLYKNNALIGYCLDTPNAVACIFGYELATKAVDMFGEEIKVSENRIENKGWISLTDCNFVRV